MLRNFKNLHGSSLCATDGEIGKVRELFFDDEHWKVRYFLVTTGSWLTGREVLIAPWVIGGIDEIEGTFAVQLTKDEVRHSPPVESDKPVSRQYEERIYQHYGWDPYWSFTDGGMGYGMPLGGGVSPILPIGAEPQPEKPVLTHLRSSGELSGYRIHALDAELGKVEDFVIDDQGWNIRYLVIRPGNWPTHTHVLLSPEWIEKVSYNDAEVVVNLPSAMIRSAPNYDPSVIISRGYEDELHAHYERDAYWVPKAD